MEISRYIEPKVSGVFVDRTGRVLIQTKDEVNCSSWRELMDDGTLGDCLYFESLHASIPLTRLTSSSIRIGSFTPYVICIDVTPLDEDMDEVLCAHVCDRRSTAFTLIGLLECVKEEMVNG